MIRQTLRKRPPPPHVRVKLDIPDSLPSLKVDPLQVSQVFMNIARNAVEVMEEGGDLTIRAERDREPSFLRISFRDTGPGISPEGMAKLFQPLFTTKAKGIGLGLTVVKNLTEANGGRIEVSSEVGKGTVFTVILPVQPISERGPWRRCAPTRRIVS